MSARTRAYMPTAIVLAAVIGLGSGLVFVSGCRSVPAASPLASVVVRSAVPIHFRGVNSSDAIHPGETDSNSPAHWDHGMLYVFNSAGQPWRSSGRDVFRLDADYRPCTYNNQANGGRWIEATWKSDDGALYGWYHLEPGGIFPGAHPESPKMKLTAPRIGAVKSTDNGATWQDLGIILEAPPPLRCDTKNYYFAGGNGDFSVMLDSKGELLYFFVSSYTAAVAEQGVVLARMDWSRRDGPVGQVWKWHDGSWTEPGLGGKATPVFPVAIDWHRADADAFWGPSIHWNTYLRQYVMLLNRAKDGRWTQEGLYVSFNPDLAKPKSWSAPQKMLESTGADRWYPQVMGLEKNGTDKLAGRTARLFVRGESRWEIEFRRRGERNYTGVATGCRRGSN